MEVANKLILAYIQNSFEGMSNKWVDELNTTLWVVRTLTRAIGETTYALVYHSEVVAPVGLALPTPRVSLHNPAANKRMRSLDLD